MAGGVGSRFWPMSKLNIPKQFIDILGIGKSLIRMTYERFLPIIPSENIFVVTNDIYKNLVQEQIPGLNPNQIICEPTRRNTAPCIAYATYKIASINPGANFIVTPSDSIGNSWFIDIYVLWNKINIVLAISTDIYPLLGKKNYRVAIEYL